MAAFEGPVRDLSEEATCSICLDYFRDPVIIPECGHNFCRSCLIQCWEKSEGEASCPQCRKTVEQGSIRRNQQLANFVEIIKKFSHLGEKEEGEGKGKICEKHQEPLKLFCKEDQSPVCVVCHVSKEHKRHEVVPLEEASQEYKDQISSCLDNVRKEREKILVFKANTEKESQDLLKQTDAEREKMVAEFRRLHQFLEEQEKRILAQMAEVEKEIAAQREEQLARLSRELSSLEHTIREMEEKLQEPASELLQDIGSFLQRNAHIVVPWFSIRSRRPFNFQYLRQPRRTLPLGQTLQKQQSTAASDVQLPRRVRRRRTSFQRSGAETFDYRGVQQPRSQEKENLEDPPVAFPPALKWKIWEFCDINPFLEGVMKKFRDTVEYGLQLRKENVTLDPDTANPALILSEDRKSVRDGEVRQDLPDNPERFDTYGYVLGCEGFTSGRHFWEVIVGKEEGWAVGVARKSVKRKGEFCFDTTEGIWGLGKWDGVYELSSPHEFPLPSEEPKRIRVTLNFEGRRVSFYDADTAVLLYTFSAASFSGETLQPYFFVSGKANLSLS
ncbi:E3 ubiquitin-protein ligase TRIM7-like [Podarcis lilfordi]|uniref:E3 ubiquitin-protein ligase TRIM7-like n=1 Tax=Podarcis lilfordi TaxID=74358 RepID=A0AA35JZN9_9SAUR|nr:E3 ubiquitin-protein ligase TRIM7-like [Podarcis lilfordi]